jgi:hypothetical protein
VNGLEEEYQGALACVILDATTPEGEAQIKAYGFGSHGMVIFDASGNVQKKLDGHYLSEATIREAVQEVMGMEEEGGDERVEVLPRGAVFNPPFMPVLAKRTL